ncbi:MAG: phospho-N-acetylmuramoyl-pentapeptide-transferase [Planctomycetia bacterium]|nr:phospho-N-acetylmuramoyl-pentapeptide-transferase [Planctomycetia bacterium]
MLLWLIERFPEAAWPGLGKITLRGALAAMASFLLALALGPRLIGWLRRHFREPIRSDSAELRRLHQAKESTPTMGGLFLVAGLVAGLIVFGDLANRFIQVALVVALGLAAVGAIDDLIKLRGRTNGLSWWTKLLGQWLVAAAAVTLLYMHHTQEPEVLMPWVPLLGSTLPLGLGVIPLGVLVIVGASNAVNLTDGLDGLAGGCLVFAIGAMGVVAYASGHAELAEYLNLPRVRGAGEMAVLAGAMIGGVMGFLWFNCHPAQVFMGDTGSLPLGGLLGLIAVATRQELLLVLVGGVFVAEAASVILQVIVYRWRGRRVFLCAPIHHHFQFRGWPENRIVVRFWIASAVCAILGVACLKWNVHEPPPLSPPLPPPVVTASGHAPLAR